MLKKRLGLYVLILLLIVAGFLIWKNFVLQPIHKPVNIEDVKSIRIWGDGLTEGHQGRIATTEETEQIIHWFNHLSDIRINKEFAGSTPPAGIRIFMSNRQEISILDSGQNFEIQKDTIKGRISYWAKNSELDAFLKSLGE